MLLCTQDAVEARLGRPLTADEALRIDPVIADVSAFVLVIAPRIPRTLPVPDAVTAVVCELVIAHLSGSSGVVSESLGGYAVTYAADRVGADGLTARQTAALAPWRKPRIGAMAINPAGPVVTGRVL